MLNVVTVLLTFPSMYSVVTILISCISYSFMTVFAICREHVNELREVFSGVECLYLPTLALFYLPYCPEQESMGAHSSSVKIWGWAVTQRTCLSGSTIPMQVSCHGTEWTCIVGSSVIRRGQPDSGESCIVLQSWLTHSLVAKFPQHSVVTCSTQISCCRERTLRMMPRTGVWNFDAWCRVAQSTSEQSQLCELSGPTFDSLCELVGGYTENPEKPQNCQNWGVDGCTYTQDNTVHS